MREKVQETIWRKMQRIAMLLSVLALTCSAAACGASDQSGPDGTQTAEGAAARQEETAESGEASGQSGNEQQDEAAGQDPTSIEEAAKQQEGETTMRIRVTGNGQAVSGAEGISGLSGTIEIRQE